MYSITIKTIEGNIIRFTTDKYELKDGHITFIDKKFNLKKSFPSQNASVDEVKG